LSHFAGYYDKLKFVGQLKFVEQLKFVGHAKDD